MGAIEEVDELDGEGGSNDSVEGEGMEERREEGVG